MDFFIDFYKGLDALNLIIFWGVIIVVILLLIFSITIANKNKKLKMIINLKEKNDLTTKDQIFPDEIAINTKTSEEKKETELQPETSVATSNSNILNDIHQVEEEKNFIAEEHVMEEDNDLFSIPTIKKTTEHQEEKNRSSIKSSEIKLPNAPYQRNVLREMSLNQTSPIGIVKPINKEDKILNKAEELTNSFKEADIHEEKNDEVIYQNELSKNITINDLPKEKNIETKTIEINHLDSKNQDIKENYKKIDSKEILSENNNHINNLQKELSKENRYTETKKDNYFEKNINQSPVSKKDSYLEEVSKKLAEAEGLEEIDRTEYELKQEEEAIISYEELMQKKDTIKIIDEEEAVISIEELLRKKEQSDKLYNLTEEEENDKFINELKNFRNDL